MFQQSSRFFPPAEWKERCEHWRWTVLIANRTYTTSLNESKRCVSWFSWVFVFFNSYKHNLASNMTGCCQEDSAQSRERALSSQRNRLEGHCLCFFPDAGRDILWRILSSRLMGSGIQVYFGHILSPSLSDSAVRSGAWSFKRWSSIYPPNVSYAHAGPRSHVNNKNIFHLAALWLGLVKS